MTALFPASGVPAADAQNSLPNPSTVNCSQLWYSTSRCQPRFDPAAANAELAELINLINKGEVVYDCNRLDQVQLAVRYLIQRGLPNGTVLQGGPFSYIAALDPPLTRYNDFLTLVVVPSVNNQGAVQVNVDGHGYVPVLRNDDQQLEYADLRANVPALISYWGGAFHHVGIASSQVPLLVKGSVDIWIRTDGNDTTGDGSANSADKAFRTIAGAWAKAGARYAASPLFTMNLRLGIPGTYQGAFLTSFGGHVNLMGDVNNRSAYRLSSFEGDSNLWVCVATDAMASLRVSGLTFVMDAASPKTIVCLRPVSSNIALLKCDFVVEVANVNSAFILAFSSSVFTEDGDYHFNANNLAIGAVISANDTSNVLLGGHSSSTLPKPNLYFENCHVSNTFLNVTSLSVMQFGSPDLCNVINTNCTGSKYTVSQNSILNMNGSTGPGDIAGTVGSGGQFVA